MNADVVYCPLCNVPHRAAVTTCDHCGHVIGEPIDLDQLRLDRAACKSNVTVAVIALVMMLALNIALFGGAGFIILTAPVGWGVWNWTRLRTIDGRLARVTSSGVPTD